MGAIFDIAEVVGADFLPKLLADLERVEELALIDIADDLVILYQKEIVAAGSVDTGHFLNTVQVRRASQGERMLSSVAFYSGVVRAKGKGGEVIGPAIAERAMNNMGRSIDNAFNRYVI